MSSNFNANDKHDDILIGIGGNKRHNLGPNFINNYDVVEKINSGSFAVVYKCIKKQVNEIYAVKFIKKNQLKAVDRETIINEIAINNKLSHRNIVQLYETYDSVQISYLVFEFIDGGELFDEIVSKEKYSEMDACNYCLQLFEALKHCHKLSIVHRDIKPENILLKRLRGSMTLLKLADFGVSKDLSASKSASAVLPVAGSLGYMAPEVVKKRKSSCRSDIYSAGIILYILLCGYPPFPQVNDKKVMINATKYPNIQFNKNWESFSHECIDLVQKMTIVNPKNRFDINQVLDHKWCRRPNEIKNINEQRHKSLMELKQFNIWRKFVAMLGALSVADNLLSRIESTENRNENNNIYSQSSITSMGDKSDNDNNKIESSPISIDNHKDLDKNIVNNDKQSDENSTKKENDQINRLCNSPQNQALVEAVKNLEKRRMENVEKFEKSIDWSTCMVYVGHRRIKNFKSFREECRKLDEKLDNNQNNHRSSNNRIGNKINDDDKTINNNNNIQGDNHKKYNRDNNDNNNNDSKDNDNNININKGIDATRNDLKTSQNYDFDKCALDILELNESSFSIMINTKPHDDDNCVNSNYMGRNILYILDEDGAIKTFLMY